MEVQSRSSLLSVAGAIGLIVLSNLSDNIYFFDALNSLSLLHFKMKKEVPACLVFICRSRKCYVTADFTCSDDLQGNRSASHRLN